jgi:AcrR family transcriptional regulator
MIGAQGGRPERREQTREALLAAAERLWAERGIHGASLDDVSAAAGLTKGAVYSNFTGKTDLLLALLERHTRGGDGDGVCGPLREPAVPPAECYRGRPAGDEARRRALLMAEFWLYGMRDYAAGWRLAEWYDERRRRVAADLAGTGGVPAADRASLVLAMEIGLAAQQLLDPERVPAELLDTALRLLLTG